MRAPGAVLAALAILELAGCGGRGIRTTQPVAPPPAAPSETAPSTAPAPPAPAPPAATVPEPASRLSPADNAYASGADAMAEGNHERALELFAAAWKDTPGHPGVSNDFQDALIGLKNGGDQSFRNGRLEEAGRRWSAALRYISHPAEKGKPLPFTKADLKASIDKLSASIMEKGLVEYRKGNLEAAIASWRSILSYDPSHAEANKSVHTAVTQLENLKKITPPK